MSKKFKHLPSGNVLDAAHHPSWLFENSKDWIEFKENSKDFEILEFKHPQGIISLRSNGNYLLEGNIVSEYSPGATLNTMLRSIKQDSVYSIHKVKRLSDNVEYTIGDYVKCKENEVNGIIQKFEISDKSSTLFVYTTWSGIGFSLDQWDGKIQKKIGTTQDGIDIYDSNTMIFGVLKDLFNRNKDIEYTTASTAKNFNQSSSWYWFKDPSKRDEYFLMNFPILTLAQLKELSKYTIASEDLFTNAISLVKGLLKQL